MNRKQILLEELRSAMQGGGQSEKCICHKGKYYGVHEVDFKRSFAPIPGAKGSTTPPAVSEVFFINQHTKILF